MDLITLDRKFLRQDAIDAFQSAIWTERYYGDGEVELIVPATPEMIQKLAPGTFLGLVGSREVMMLETHDIDEGKLTIKGLSLLPWLNNRFIRVTTPHEDRYWNLTGYTAGQTLWVILYTMCVSGVYPSGPGLNPAEFVIPGLSLKDYDTSGSPITVAVPYGPLYDAMKSIGTTYQVGMSITLESANEAGYSIQFRSYRGLDRTSGQVINPVVRFSPKMDSFTKIKELQSIANFKTRIYTYAPSNPGGLASTPGFASVSNPGTPATGFDLRALMVFADDLSTDNFGGSADSLLSLLNQRANLALQDHQYAKYVDGEIVPTAQFQYGVNYNMGDIIEVEGNSGITQRARVTEYIRAQDDAGERAYPTVSMIE